VDEAASSFGHAKREGTSAAQRRKSARSIGVSEGWQGPWDRGHGRDRRRGQRGTGRGTGSQMRNDAMAGRATALPRRFARRFFAARGPGWGWRAWRAGGRAVHRASLCQPERKNRRGRGWDADGSERGCGAVVSQRERQADLRSDGRRRCRRLAWAGWQAGRLVADLHTAR